MIPQRESGIRLERNGDDGVLVDGSGTERCLLNATAAAVWELCDGHTAVEEMATAVCALWNVSYDQAMTDLTVALDALSDAGVIVLRASPE